jgi:1-acyl-sn-glycerol-3-phosphate acyltransferase
MNQQKTQTPYRFVTPKYTAWFRPILHLLSAILLRCQHKVCEVKITGAEQLSELVESGHAVLVTPNHSDHADPGLMITVGKRNGFAFHFMAAREGFEAGKLNRFVLQRGGAFSINREGGDVMAIKTAIRILEERKHPLVIFPEGEIYHHMETLDELNDGVASIALRAMKKLPDGKRGYIVPSAIRLYNDPSSEVVVSDRLTVLEKRILWKPRIDRSPVERILDLGSAILSIKEEEHLGAAQSGTLYQRLVGLREALVVQVESAHDALNESVSIPKRIKAIRATIRKELTNKDSPPNEEREKELYEQLDKVFLAHQLYSYPGAYLNEKPSLDRIAETIYKLEEDMLGKARHLGRRKAEIVFGEPIDVGVFLDENSLNSKSGVIPLTEMIRERIQGMLGS